jgi:hypothetical protein
MDRSVYERFDGPPVQQYDRVAQYRPETLRNHLDFKDYYFSGPNIPADSLRNATAMAAEPTRPT